MSNVDIDIFIYSHNVKFNASDLTFITTVLCFGSIVCVCVPRGLRPFLVIL